MKSTGNDIVALGSVDKHRTGQYRFYSKILSASEQTLYQQMQFANLPFEHYLWLLWSVKESTFKFLKRSKPELIFSPAKIIIQYLEIPAMQSMTKMDSYQSEFTGNAEEFYRAKVNFGSDILYSRSKISKDWVATVVNDDERFENVYWGIQATDGTDYYHQSKAARSLLLNKINFFFPGDLTIKKSPIGYPVIMKVTEDMKIPASLAHHGRFVTYSFILNLFNDDGSVSGLK